MENREYDDNERMEFCREELDRRRWVDDPYMPDNPDDAESVIRTWESRRWKLQFLN